MRKVVYEVVSVDGAPVGYGFVDEPIARFDTYEEANKYCINEKYALIHPELQIKKIYVEDKKDDN